MAHESRSRAVRGLRSLAALLLVGLSLGIGSARGEAQTDELTEARRKAATHFDQGVALFEEGASRAALIEFQRAYDLVPDYRLLYNIGHAQMEVHDYLRATQSYERYLHEGGAAITPERRAEVEAILRSLAGRVGRLAIQVDEPGAEVFVDDQRAGVSPLAATVPVSVGRHRVYARTSRGAVGEQILDVAGGELVEVELSLTASAPLAAEPPLRLRPPEPPPSRALSRRRRAAIVTWSLLAPSAAAAVVTALLASRKNDDLSSALGVRPATAASKGEAEQLRDSVRRLGLASDVMTGVSAVLAVTGIVLWVGGGDRGHDSSSDGGRAGSVSLGLGLGTAHVSGHFSL